MLSRCKPHLCATVLLMAFLWRPNVSYAQVTLTDLYVLRALDIVVRYSDAIDHARQKGDVVRCSRLWKACAAELYNIPTFGVNPDVVATVRSGARLCDSIGSACLELNDPTVPDELKAARIIDLWLRFVDFCDRLERLR
jgi:hypothetical protein